MVGKQNVLEGVYPRNARGNSALVSREDSWVGRSSLGRISTPVVGPRVVPGQGADLFAFGTRRGKGQLGAAKWGELVGAVEWKSRLRRPGWILVHRRAFEKKTLCRCW